MASLHQQNKTLVLVDPDNCLGLYLSMDYDFVWIYFSLLRKRVLYHFDWISVPRGFNQRMVDWMAAVLGLKGEGVRGKFMAGGIHPWLDVRCLRSLHPGSNQLGDPGRVRRSVFYGHGHRGCLRLFVHATQPESL